MCDPRPFAGCVDQGVLAAHVHVCMAIAVDAMATFTTFSPHMIMMTTRQSDRLRATHFHTDSCSRSPEVLCAPTEEKVTEH